MAIFAEEELAEGITKVILEGRIDIAGAAAIDTPLSTVAESKKAVLLDLQKVSFIGSIGLRSIVISSRKIERSGGKMVLFGPNEMIAKVLKASGIDTFVPIHHDLQNAIAALR